MIVWQEMKLKVSRDQIIKSLICDDKEWAMKGFKPVDDTWLLEREFGDYVTCDVYKLRWPRKSLKILLCRLRREKMKS